MPDPEDTASTGPDFSRAVSISEPERASQKNINRAEEKHASNDSTHTRYISGPYSLSERPPLDPSLRSLRSVSGADDSGPASRLDTGIPEDGEKKAHHSHSHSNRHTPRHQHHSHQIISQVADWLKQEKAKKATNHSKRDFIKSKLADAISSTASVLKDGQGYLPVNNGEHRRTTSGLSDEGVDFEKLELILAGATLSGDGLHTPTDERRRPRYSRHSSLRPKTLKRSSTVASSDTDYLDGDPVIPSTDVILDNSKTLAYSGGAANSEANLLDLSKRARKEKEAWLLFKNEIVRLAHTLRLKGWRKVPLDHGKDIDVERLSGAMTNAVYVVSPPSNMQPSASGSEIDSSRPRKSISPQKLLLRIYGPQVEHLIDRDCELQILRRLRRKKIGPNLLGTFTNGRFEQFFHSRTLTAKDLRLPQTSKQIAKRMRELHDGVELLEEERDAGASVWKNWDKWVDRCEEVITWLDHEILSGTQGPVKSISEEWKKRGLVCGVEWAEFRNTVEIYRRWLNQQYGGAAGIRKQLVFAHNDTQYGNLLRLNPPGESPLLTPANEHKQLIVIDFEYASANVPGYEFANHFSEWCYNYHDESKPWAYNNKAYPTPDEQHRFLKAYIQHQPFTSSTPTPTGNPSSSTSSFILDSSALSAQVAEEDRLRDQAAEAGIKRLRHDARLWRVANSAMWIAWGIVQAKVAGMNEALQARKRSVEPMKLDSDPLSQEVQDLAKDVQDRRPEICGPEAANEDEDEIAEEEEEFDYLGYSQDRAMFFWGDVLQLGIVKREGLPQELLEKIKIVEY